MAAFISPRRLVHFQKARILKSSDKRRGDLDMIFDTCDRVILLSKGRIAADGSARKILYDRELLEMHRMELPLSLMGRE